MRRVSLLITVLIGIACGSQDSPERLAEQAKTIGVYVRTSQGLLHLDTFGVEDINRFTERMGFAFNSPIPEVDSVDYFVINIPEATISESKIFLLDDIESARWRYFNLNHPSNPQPIPSRIEPVMGSIHKVVPKLNEGNVQGFLGLWVRMPMGTSERMYAVKVSS